MLDYALIAHYMNALPFVRWDRFVADENGDGVVYGWIRRDDGRDDFVVLEFEGALAEANLDAIGIGFTTSSAAHSRDISELLGMDVSEHIDCQRVDEHFGDHVDKKVVLT